tara:strand:+ start:68 stop:496 length:429 start_codon:yes stop_codon:yes gene_type:complete
MKVTIGKPPHKSDQKQKVRVKIHKHDTWNMDQTLAYIIVPMLKQLAETTVTGPPVELKDVPSKLRPKLGYETPDHGMDYLYFDRWNWVLNEMIFAFSAKIDPSIEDQYFTEDGYDEAGMEKHQKRVANGFRLFGKYYESLWD